MDNLALHGLKSLGSILRLDQTYGTITIPVLVSQVPNVVTRSRLSGGDPSILDCMANWIRRRLLLLLFRFESINNTFA